MKNQIISILIAFLCSKGANSANIGLIGEHFISKAYLSFYRHNLAEIKKVLVLVLVLFSFALNAQNSFESVGCVEDSRIKEKKEVKISLDSLGESLWVIHVNNGSIKVKMTNVIGQRNGDRVYQFVGFADERILGNFVFDSEGLAALFFVKEFLGKEKYWIYSINPTDMIAEFRSDMNEK